MGCHPDALERISDQIRCDPTHADHYLDQWISVTTRATEWDATFWGFDPDRWMAAERREMERRACSNGSMDGER